MFRQRQRASGLTLIEILAAVFVLAMGLILVAAAFPVGVQQSELMQQDMNSSMFATELVDMIRADLFSRKMSDADFTNKFKQNTTASIAGTGTTAAEGNPKWWMVHNVRRSYYELASGTDTDMLPVRMGDLYCLPYITRLSADGLNEVPLYRVTMPMLKYKPQRMVYVSVKLNGPATGTTLMAANKAFDKVAVGDTIMDMRNGYCYEVQSKNDTGSSIVLDRTPVVAFDTNNTILCIGQTDEVYYALLSH